MVAGQHLHGLALAIRAHEGDTSHDTAWRDIAPLLPYYCDLVRSKVEPRHQAGRVKQWLNYLRKRHPQAQVAYDRVRTVTDPVMVKDILLSVRDEAFVAGGAPESVACLCQ